MSGNERERAIVLGGSIAGLLAARVLAETFGEVVVVDRDDLRDDLRDGLRDGLGDDAQAAAPRRGTPQARHIHGLLARGHDALEELFAGLTDELVGQGARVGDMLADCRVLFGGHRFAPGPSGLTALCVSRPALERAVRRRVADLPGVRLLGRTDVVGLVADRDAQRVLGARVMGRADGSAEEELRGDLVVDATGRGSRLPGWLESLGHPRPPVEQMRVGVGYASRQYRLAPGALGDDVFAVSGPTPERPRGGALSLIEQGRCLVTLMGVLGDHPPTDAEGFERFAADLALADLRNALQDAEPLDDPVGYRHPTSLRHRYDLVRTPAGIVAVGDAVCALNPIYGQGMTVAALEAVALRRHLATGSPDLRRFQREVARISGVAWTLSSGADLTFPQVEGRRTPATRMLGRYVARIQAGAAVDPVLGRAFLRVTSMVDDPPALVRPAVLRRSLRRPAVAV